jgi:putative Holliday junction resolvase
MPIETDKNSEDREFRWMGLDVGEERIGVAVSDSLKMTAQPYRVVARKDTPRAIREILDIAREKKVERIIVGMPLGLRGDKGVMARRITEFAAQLAEETDIPTEEWDERYSTRVAERALLEGNVSRKRRRQVRDKTAAALILQNYIDSKSGGIITSESQEIWMQEQRDERSDTRNS